MRLIYVFFWRLANRVRRAMGQPAQPKRCCKRPYNLVKLPSHRSDLAISACRICHCKHYEVTLDPGKLGVKGQSF